MGAVGTAEFDFDNVCRGHVEIRFRKSCSQTLDVIASQFDHHINVIGEPRLAVKDCRGGAGDHVGRAELFERPDEKRD